MPNGLTQHFLTNGERDKLTKKQSQLRCHVATIDPFTVFFTSQYLYHVRRARFRPRVAVGY